MWGNVKYIRQVPQKNEVVSGMKYTELTVLTFSSKNTLTSTTKILETYMKFIKTSFTITTKK